MILYSWVKLSKDGDPIEIHNHNSYNDIVQFLRNPYKVCFTINT